MEPSERTHVLENLTESRSKMMDAVRGVREDQWDFRPDGERWSIAECLEHVVLVENRIVKSIGKMLERTPEPEKKEQVAGKDAFLKGGAVLDRTHKFNAPEHVTPRRHWPDCSQLVAEFVNTRARTIEFVSSTQGDLRSHFFPHIAFGELDCYQWLMLLPKHCERHVAQIEEIKAHFGVAAHQGN